MIFFFSRHMDGNEKMQSVGLYVHGLIDGYSRKVMYIFVSSNKRSGTVMKVFREFVRKYGFPKIVRSDKGGENVKVAEFILSHRGLSETSFITGKSVHNIRIERFWGEVNRISVNYRDLFLQMSIEGTLNLDDPLHMYALHYVFIPRIQWSLNSFRRCWNFHRIRTAHNKTPEELFLTGTHPEVSLVDEDIGENEADPNEYEAEFSVFSSFAEMIIPNPLHGDGEENFITLINAIEAERNSL